ncbi:MAG: LuxR C-terminal-related transcriptional regulator, partial [Flavisolibacter sp.]
IMMPKMDGIEATQILSKKFPEIKIIGLSMHDDENIVLQMLEAGAQGYLIKNAHKDELIKAIKVVNTGGHYFDNHITKKLAKMIASFRFGSSPGKHNVSFSEREKKIIELICEGYSGKEIAQKLQLSARTIENYRDSIIQKMDVRNTAGLIIYAIRNKLYELS